jgi:cytokinesis protein
MDSLLEKLRAAAPQARDQRDRRRRARLKDRHQVRIASGQKIPEFNEIPEVEAGLQSAKSAESGDGGDVLSPTTDGGLASPKEGGGGEDDVAERAALLLQGMRTGEVDGDEEKRESLRRSRRQTADEERKMRRRRRERTGTGDTEVKNGEERSEDVEVRTPTTTEEGSVVGAAGGEE